MIVYNYDRGFPVYNQNSGFFDAVAKWLRKQTKVDVTNVIKLEQKEETFGLCETCQFEEIVVYINYATSDGRTLTYTYIGEMDELIRELTDE